MIDAFTPIFIKLLEEGKMEGIINCTYLRQSVEMLLIYGNFIFDKKECVR